MLSNKSTFLPLISLVCSLIIFLSCTKTIRDQVYLGQGIMSGEIDTSSVILQARLTISDTLVDGYLPGVNGQGQFEISKSESFTNELKSEWIEAVAQNDFIIKVKMSELEPNTRYFYRLKYGIRTSQSYVSETGTFVTLPGAIDNSQRSFVVVTGMNYHKFHFGDYHIDEAYSGPDKDQGYPALQFIVNLKPDYFIGTGDNVYFDHPVQRNYQRALNQGKNPSPGFFDGKAVTDEAGMRRKYHLQFVQPRFKEMFRQIGTYWEKDDHDYRFNDADPYQDLPISHELGIKNFKEQLPVTDPDDPQAKTYRSFRMNKDLQVWMVEGRDYRSANEMEDGPDKTLWGTVQLDWLKNSLLASDAKFKVLVSPTPMVGPDDAYKRDNHVNHRGFRQEGDQFFEWLIENDFLDKHFYIVCGDRHWKYHARHPSGFEEFSCGALVDNTSRAGRLAGDPRSTDPDSLIEQYFIEGSPEDASGGFLLVKVHN